MSKRPLLTYQIIVHESLDESWEAWFTDIYISHLTSGKTVLSGKIVDQVRLFTILNKIRDLNLTLYSVKQIES